MAAGALEVVGTLVVSMRSPCSSVMPYATRPDAQVFLPMPAEPTLGSGPSGSAHHMSASGAKPKTSEAQISCWPWGPQPCCQAQWPLIGVTCA